MRTATRQLAHQPTCRHNPGGPGCPGCPGQACTGTWNAWEANLERPARRHPGTLKCLQSRLGMDESGDTQEQLSLRAPGHDTHDTHDTHDPVRKPGTCAQKPASFSRSTRMRNAVNRCTDSPVDRFAGCQIRGPCTWREGDAASDTESEAASFALSPCVNPEASRRGSRHRPPPPSGANPCRAKRSGTCRVSRGSPAGSPSSFSA